MAEVVKIPDDLADLLNQRIGRCLDEGGEGLNRNAPRLNVEVVVKQV